MATGEWRSHTRLWATLAATPNAGVGIGDLVLVEVPPNCSVHADDSQRMAEILATAEEIGRHWRDQEGVNAALIDKLARLTDRPEAIAHDEPKEA